MIDPIHIIAEIRAMDDAQLFQRTCLAHRLGNRPVDDLDHVWRSALEAEWNAAAVRIASGTP